MRSSWPWSSIPAAILIGFFLSAAVSAAPAASRTDLEPTVVGSEGQAGTAHRLVLSALEAEAVGAFAMRERLLREAAETEAAAAARSHLGMIDVGARKPDWKTIEESMAAAGKDATLHLYERVRGQTPDTAAGHLDLARWCLSRKMADQARAHLSRLLEFVPDHAAARAALGYVRMGDTWVSPGELRRLQMLAETKTRSIERHRKTLAPLVVKLKSTDPDDRAAVRAAFLEVRDPTMVGAVETALESPDRFVSTLLVDWMAQVDTPESSLVLTRYGLLHPDEAVRNLATDKLLARPLHDFVPTLLAMLSSPITMTIQPSYDPQGRLVGYRQAFGREVMGENDVQVIDRGFQRMIDGGNPAQLMAADAAAEAVIRQQAQAEVQARRQDMLRQNEAIARVNDRIAAVIARVSGRFLPVAADMWLWWDEYNETEYQKYKTDRVRHSYSIATVAFSTPPTSTPECFVAGTPVVTKVGLKPIETILPGDLVLNRDLATGALRWQPVLRATTRPPAATIAVTPAGTSRTAETFRCSTGHLFWVSGKGWTKASALHTGDILHAAGTPVRIARLEEQPSATTYNLEVADAPNYFVGRAMLLTHDVTPREAERQGFPGQDHLRRAGGPWPTPESAAR